MPLIPPGQNVRYFDPLVPEANFVAKVTASSNEYSSKIDFRVPDRHKAIVTQCLKEASAKVIKQDAGSFGTWFMVNGLVGIKTSLDHLNKKKLITDDFYQTIVERFPKAYGGTLNLSSTSTSLIDEDPLEHIFTRSIVSLPESVPSALESRIRFELQSEISHATELASIEFTPELTTQRQTIANINGTQKTLLKAL
jgi:hypothetical protein